MKRNSPAVLLFLLLTGCSDKTAREYAVELTKLLDEYSKRVDHLIVGETARYRDEAKALEAATNEAALDALTSERRKVVTKQYLDGLINGSADAARLLTSALPEYAERDYNTTRDIYTKLNDAYTAHLSAIQPLAADKAKIGVVRAAFASLAKEPNMLELAGQFKKFGDDLKDNLDYERCVDLKAQAETIAAAVTDITTKINALAVGTPARLALEETRNGMQAELTTVTAQRDKTGRFNAGECTRPEPPAPGTPIP